MHAAAAERFRTRGWLKFPAETAVRDWAARARPAALRAIRDPALARWHQCRGTWFVGLDALDNDASGRVGGSRPLAGAAVDFLRAEIGEMPALHRAQVSAVFPGYPRPREGETEAAFGYRLRRDAAHIDGLVAEGPERRRRIGEPHAFILGLPLTRADAQAAPLVVWEGSHILLAQAFAGALAGRDPETWGDADVTEVYQAARRRVFDSCRRIVLAASPGEAVLLNRLILHGVAPWAAGACADAAGRVIAYFRPPMPGGVPAWIRLP